MKKNLRTFLIMLLVLVVLGGGAAVLLLTQPSQEESSTEESSSSEAAIPVLEVDPETVASIQVKNTNATFTIVPVEEEEASQAESSAVSSQTSSDSSLSSKEESSAVVFTIQEYDAYGADHVAITDSTEALLSLSANKEMGQLEDLEKYGLSGEEASVFTLHYTDGSTEEITVGTQAGESVGRYVLKDGEVYICDMDEGLLGSPMDFVDTQVYSVADRTDNTGTSSEETLEDVLYSVEITRPGEDSILIQYDDVNDSYEMWEPIRASASNASSRVTALKSLTSQAVVCDRTDENLATYGLTEPAAEVTFLMNEEVHTLQVSAKNEDGNRYLVADEGEFIYLVSDSDVEAWTDAQVEDLRDSTIWQPGIAELSSLTFTVEGDQVYQYTVTRTEDEDASTDTSISYTYTVADPSGAEVEYETYQELFDQAMGISILSMDQATYGDTPQLQVEVEYFDGSDPVQINYYKVEGQDRYAATLNDQYNGLVRSSDIDSLISLIQGA